MCKSFSLNIKGSLHRFETPVVMGIINLTPDSFYKGGRLTDKYELLKLAEKHLKDGAYFLDIGAYSSRPGASQISLSEELNRITTPLEAITKEFPKALISVDTFRSEVAQHCIDIGAHIINDISAGDDDPEMVELIAKMNVPYIIMHKQGTAENMQKNPIYQNVVTEVAYYLANKVAFLNSLGVKDIIIDPGFGFGKTVNHNYELLRGLEHFAQLDCPILVGLSRKSMINKVIGTTPSEALNGTTVLHTLALQNKASILRVHDVKEAYECIQLWNQFENSSTIG